VKGLAVVSTVLMLVPATGAPQSAPEQTSPSAVFRSGASLVALSVTVTGPDKRFVNGLGAEDFAVYEDGIQQEVRFFESRGVPIDLIILIDTSSSMRHRMQLVHQAALGFIGTLRAGDRAAVVAFNDTVTITQPFTGDRLLLEAAIRGTSGQGGTALNNAVYVALKQFGRSARETGDVRRQALALLSDGEDTASLISVDDVLEVAQKSGVTVYPIALSSEFERRSQDGGRNFSPSQYALRKLAQDTGAQAFFPASVSELPGIYASIAQELSNQYSIGYAPSNLRQDGRFRRINVRVVKRPELRPRARTGYIAIASSNVANSYDEIR
jgi:Ca-activated chloride channel family protein